MASPGPKLKLSDPGLELLGDAGLEVDGEAMRPSVLRLDLVLAPLSVEGTSDKAELTAETRSDVDFCAGCTARDCDMERVKAGRSVLGVDGMPSASGNSASKQKINF